MRSVLSFALLTLALVMIFPTAPGHAAGQDPLILTGPADIQALSPHLEYTTDPDWQLKVEDFLGPSAVEMRPLPGLKPDFGYTKARIWLRLRVVNETAALDDWRFFMHVGFLQQVAIYRIGADGTVATLIDLNEDSPFGARPVDYPQIVAPFALEPGEAATLIVAYQSMGAARHTMSIETEDSFAALARISAAKNYAFYGMMLVMIALAVVALATLRQAVFAAYAAYAASILVYIAQVDGTAFQFLWPGYPRFNSMAFAAAGSGLIVFAGIFAITFLQTARYHPVMHRVLLAVVGCVLALDAILFIVDPTLLNRLLVYLVLICVLTYLGAGIVAARTRFREVRFYVLAWGTSVIPAALFTARFAFGLEATFISPYDAIRLALIFDALMMGLAIFDRHSQLRQAAADETLAHARKSLALSQRLAAVEEQYERVTATARRREEGVKDTVHDLRQPMQALRLSLRQMFNPKDDNARDAGQVESALAFMERLVAERLVESPDAGRAGGALAAAPAGIGPDVGEKRAGEPGLHEVLRGVTDMFGAEASAKGLGLRLVLAAPDGEIAAYPLMRVMSNLVSNAIKYTREGRIVIALRRHGKGHRIEVHDTGPGLSGTSFEQALLRNRRLERDLSAAEGSGLGLAVVKEIAAANGWTITSCEGRRTGASIRMELSEAQGRLGGRERGEPLTSNSRTWLRQAQELLSPPPGGR